MLKAMAQEVLVQGAGKVTVAHVVARSGVSRRTFYEIFDDRDDCLMATLNDALAQVRGRVAFAYARGGRWHERLLNGLLAFLCALDGDPVLARLLIVESLSAGRWALERREHVVQSLTDAVDEGGQHGTVALKPTRLTAEGVVGAGLSILHGRLLVDGGGRGDRGESLLALTNSLMAMIVLPYLGTAAARRELERPLTAGPVPDCTVHEDPLGDLRMRLTYRTIRVLSAVAESPEASNRLIAARAGIADQGQISKLLARLQGFGLIDNMGGDHSRGEPNAWVLSAKGWDVHRTIGAPAAAAE